MASNVINIELIAKDLASRTIKGVGNSAEGMHKKLMAASGASKAFGLALLGTTTAAAGLVGFGSKIAGDLESARQGFVALLGSAEEADATMARIKQEAKSTPFELPGLVKGTQALAAITKDGDKAVDMLLDVGKAVAISGKGQEDLDRVVFNLQQISSTGKVTAMDIRQFQGAIPIFNDIVEATGMTVDEMMKADNAAELLADAFKQAGAEGGISAAGFTAQAGTFNQLVSNLKDNFTIFMSDIVKSTGVFDGLKNVIGKVNDFIEENGDQIKDLIKNGMEWIKKNLPIIAGVIGGALVPAFYALAASIGSTMLSLAPFMLAGAAVAFILTNFSDEVSLVVGWLRDNLLPILQRVGQFLMGAFQVAVRVVTAVFNMLKPSIMALWQTLRGQLYPAVINIWQALMKVWKAVAPVLIPILKVLGAIIIGVVVANIFIAINALRIIIKVISSVINFVAKLYRGFASAFNGIKSVVSSAAGWIGNQVNRIKNFFRSIPGAISSIGGSVKNALTSPFRTAIDGIKSLWNNSLGNFTITVPDIPGMPGRGQTFGFPRLQQGTDFFGGGLAMVGEAGREIVNLPRGSQVIPNDRTESMLGGTVNIYGNIVNETPEAANAFFDRINRISDLSAKGNPV